MIGGFIKRPCVVAGHAFSVIPRSNTLNSQIPCGGLFIYGMDRVALGTPGRVAFVGRVVSGTQNGRFRCMAGDAQGWRVVIGYAKRASATAVVAAAEHYGQHCT